MSRRGRCSPIVLCPPTGTGLAVGRASAERKSPLDEDIDDFPQIGRGDDEEENKHEQNQLEQHVKPLDLPPVVGHIRLHGSHELFCTKGVIWCNMCGQYVTMAARGLAEMCPRMCMNRASVARRARLQNAKPPKGAVWPETASQGLPDGRNWKSRGLAG